MSTMENLLADLAAETEALVTLIANLEPAGWETMTPAEPWTVRDQIGHLAYFDQQAALAASDPDAFADQVNRDIEALTGDVAELHRRRGLDGPNTLAWWLKSRRELIDAFSDLDPDRRLPWYGPAMRARSSVVARLMETWAHGTDVADALGTSLPVTDRLFRVADLGVRTFSWSFTNRGLDVPEERVRVALRGPSGTTRIWNDEENASITGPVEDFCLVVVQRRNLADTHLVMEGGLARRWMEIAQVFAGPPGPGR
jgi:uncharacterized protein (TIGR03084 family)